MANVSPDLKLITQSVVHLPLIDFHCTHISSTTSICHGLPRGSGTDIANVSHQPARPRSELGIVPRRSYDRSLGLQVTLLRSDAFEVLKAVIEKARV